MFSRLVREDWSLARCRKALPLFLLPLAGCLGLALLFVALGRQHLQEVERGEAERLLDGYLAMQRSPSPHPAAPPQGEASANAHASTLAFELTSGRRPLIVNCGSGAIFGREWQRAGRATASHSTLAIEGFSSSRLGPEPRQGHPGAALLDETPTEVWVRPEGDPAHHILAGHNGYSPTHGMTHTRELALTPDGTSLAGIDTLGAMTPEDRKRFEVIFAREGLRGIPFQIRFHLHPDADATLDMGGTAVSVALKSGEIWIFRHDGVADLALSPSVYLEPGRLRPRGALQIVLSARVLDYACQIGWTLAKAQATPAAIPEPGRAGPAPSDF